MSELDGMKINLSDKSTIQKLYSDQEFKLNFVNHVVKESVSYIEEQYPNLEAFLKTGKLPKDQNLTKES